MTTRWNFNMTELGARMALTLAGVAASLAVGFSATRQDLLPLLLVGGVAVLLVLLPIELLAVATVALASSFGDPIPGLSGNRGIALAGVIVLVLCVRCASSGGLSRAQLFFGSAVGGFLLVSGINAITLGRAGGAQDMFIAAIPYLLLLISMVSASRETARRIATYASVLAALMAALFIVGSLTGAAVFPGAYRQLPFEIGPVHLTRTYASEAPLFAFGAVWATAQISTLGRSRGSRSWSAVLIVCLLGIVVGGSRGQFVALVFAILVASLLAARRTQGLFRTWSVASVVFVGAALAIAPSLGQGYEEVRLSSGSFGTRVADFDDAAADFKARPWLGVGIAPSIPPVGLAPGALPSFGPSSTVYDVADSGYATLIIRFGLLGVGALLALVLAMSREVLNATRSEPAMRDAGALVAGMLTFGLVGAIGSEVLLSPPALATVGLAIGTLLARDRVVH